MKAWRRSISLTPGVIGGVISDVVLSDLGEGLLLLQWSWTAGSPDPGKWEVRMEYPAPAFENSEIITDDLNGDQRESIFLSAGAVGTRAKVRAEVGGVWQEYHLSNTVTPS